MPRLLSAAPMAFAAMLAVAAALPSHADAQQAASASAPAATAEPGGPLTAAQKKVYQGSYDVSTPDGPIVLRIFEESGVMRGERVGDPEKPRLIHLGNHRFQVEGNPDFVLTFTVADGRATKFNFVREGQAMEAVRKATQ